VKPVTNTIAQRFRSHFSWQKLILLVFVLLVGVGLRLIFLGDIFLWNDETDNFDEQIFKHMSTSLRRYAAAEAQELTLGPAWSITIAITCKVFGGVVMVGRMPSVFFGSAAILAIFYLVYRLVQSSDDERFFAPAFFAAALAAISIVQMEYSQRIIPYGAVPLLTTAIIIAHLKIVHIIQKKILPIEKLILWCILYTLICGFSVYLHMSLTMILASSFFLLVGTGVRLSNPDREKRVVVFGILTLSFLAVFLAWIGNAIHTQSGYRFYLAPYYHPPNIGAIPFLLSRAYDLLTYNLNLFYNGVLYWPRRLNPVLLPLIIICIIGWYYSATGRFGRIAKHLSFFGMISLLITALLSLLREYPFGGVRQTIFMSPFIFTFTGLGFWALIRSRLGKAVTGVLAITYLVLWGINLPHFYKERVFPYTTQDLVNAWEENGKLRFYGDGGCRDTIRYMLRKYPDIKIESLDFEQNVLLEPPFLLISPHWPMEDSLWLPRLKERVEELGYHAKLIMVRNAAYPMHSEYRQSLYSPANGLWLYKITKEKNQGL
jgi:uncharacterized membrane protein